MLIVIRYYECWSWFPNYWYCNHHNQKWRFVTIPGIVDSHAQLVSIINSIDLSSIHWIYIELLMFLYHFWKQYPNNSIQILQCHFSWLVCFYHLMQLEMKEMFNVCHNNFWKLWWEVWEFVHETLSKIGCNELSSWFYYFLCNGQFWFWN